jgi:hypothetical protein
VDTDDPRIGKLNLSDSDFSVNSVSFSSNYVINVVNSFSVTPEALFVQINGRHIPMHVDTGSCSTICSREDYQRYFAHRKLERVTIPLTAVDGGKLDVLGRVKVQVPRRGEQIELYLVIVDFCKKSKLLLGRDWLDILYPDWRNIFHV